MKRGDLIKIGDVVYRILEIDGQDVLCIDCGRRVLPVWKEEAFFDSGSICAEDELQTLLSRTLPSEDDLSEAQKSEAQRRFSIIAGVLPHVGDPEKRTAMISQIAQENGISRRTVQNYLCTFLIFQMKTSLASTKRAIADRLSSDQKTMRWALNRFYYTRHKNSLHTAYIYMLKEKYLDTEGQLVDDHPTFNQFRYFYRKHNKKQSEIISREGKGQYARNHRPLLGGRVQDKYPSVGTGMIDSTVCDIYLVDDRNHVVGRPYLIILTDAFSGIVYGYSLGWEGGAYSLRELLINVVSEKESLLEKYRINADSTWISGVLPGTIISDLGAEYASDTFAQISELGIKLVNLPPFRPDLKSIVERTFGLLQGKIKPVMTDHGYVIKDMTQRGVPDYRKQACLTLDDFEEAVIRSILFHNNSRILEDFPYTEQMLTDKVQPTPQAIFTWGREQTGASLIPCSRDQIIRTLLPRSTGRVTRKGILALGVRYRFVEGDHLEEYLAGKKKVVIAYDPDDIGVAFVIEKGRYEALELIESRYVQKSLAEVDSMKKKQKELTKAMLKQNLQGEIDLLKDLEIIVDRSKSDTVPTIKDMTEVRRRERHRNHKHRKEDFVE